MRRGIWVFLVVLVAGGYLAVYSARERNTEASERVLLAADPVKERVGVADLVGQGFEQPITTGRQAENQRADDQISIPPIVVESLTYEFEEGVCQLEEMGGVSFYNGVSGATDVRVIGKSSQGRDLIAEHVGAYSGEQVLVVGQTHGDECSGGMMVDYIRRNPPATWGVWLIASINPDGALLGKRRNADGVDLNRDGYNRAAPETEALLNFVREIGPRYAVYVHSPYGWVGPWGQEGSRKLAAIIAEHSGLRLNGWAGSGKGYLWEGAQSVFSEAEAVLVEFPSLSARESSAALNRGDGYVADKQTIQQMAEGAVAGLKAFFGR